MAYLNHMKEEKNRFLQNSLSMESTPSKKLQKLQKLLALMYTK